MKSWNMSNLLEICGSLYYTYVTTYLELCLVDLYVCICMCRFIFKISQVAGRPRANTLVRKGRVTRRSKLEALNLEEMEQFEKLEVEKKPAASRKRGGASSTEALKERQVPQSNLRKVCFKV